jgi:hypothetical protein
MLEPLVAHKSAKSITKKTGDKDDFDNWRGSMDEGIIEGGIRTVESIFKAQPFNDTID